MFCSLCGFSVAWFRSLWSYTVCDCFFSFRNLRERKRNLSPIILWEERSCRMTGYLTNFVRCDSFPFIQWFWARTEEKVSRLIGTHQLIHLNYYPYIARLKNISLLITLILELLKTKIKILQAPGPSPVRIHKITFIFCASCSWDGSPPTAWSRFSRRSSTTSSLRGIPLRWWLSAWMLWGSYVPGIVESLSRFSPHLLIARCPLVMTEDLLRDLVEYETYVQGQSRDD